MIKKMMASMLAVACMLAFMPALAEGAAGVPNPVRDVTEEELLSLIGVTIPVPEGAVDIAYSVIEADDQPVLAQVQFSLDDMTYLCRVQAGDAISDISGMYYEWTAENAVELPNALEAQVLTIEGEAGILLWYNEASGLCFSLSMEDGASEAKLVSVAEPIAAAQADDGERMAVTYEVVDESWLNVRLAANATTGYAWKYEISNEEMLACDGTDYEPDEGTEGLAGAGGTYIAAFSPTMGGAGAVTLTFRYARDWETEEPVEAYVFSLWITEAGTLSVESVE